MNARPSAEELLSHEWIQGNTQFPYVERKVAGQISENLAAFRKLNSFQTGIVCLLSSMMIQEKDVIELRKVFERCDKDNNGVLSP